MATLTIQPPGSPPVSHLLKDTVTIGRMGGNTVVINDASVSLVHAKITRKNGEFFLKDLNSTNGTLVNGQAVVEARLRDLDELRFADVSGHFRAEPAAATAEPLARAPMREAAQAQPVTGSENRPPPASRRSAPLNLRRLITSLVSIAGGTAALAVISFLAWRFVQRGQDFPRPAPDSAPAAVAANRAVSHEPSAPVPEQRRLPKTNPSPVLAAAPETNGPSGRDLPQLVRALKDSDPAERRQAVAALHSMGSAAGGASSALHDALADTDQEVRFWAALTLINNQSYDKAMPPILVGVLHDEKPMIRQLACLSLGLLPYEPAEKQTVVPALVAAATNDTDQEVREAAVSALAVIDPDATGKVSLK